MSKIKHILNQSFFITTVTLLMIGVNHAASAAVLFQIQQQETTYREYKGEILDKQSKKPLIFASLTLADSNISTISNTEGQFALKVPKSITEGDVIISFLGYRTIMLPLVQMSDGNNRIFMEESVLELSEVNLIVPKNARLFVQQTLAKKGDNYFDDPTLMTAFYRETIKRRKKNVSLSEAVVNIYKTPYNSERKDAVQLYKARKSTDYTRLDTVALKLQGGPFNALYVDIMKYPEYIFTEETMEDYIFNFDRSVQVNDKLVFVVDFKQREGIREPMYKGKLYIDAENKILTSAIYTLNITDRELAARLFVRKKPAKASVWPTEVAYRVDYREKGGKWYYGYSNVLLEFKINWEDKFFNSVYSMSCEMAVTDWETNLTGQFPKSKDRIRSSIILSDAAIGFADPDFWGEYNIIEPEKSIESAIKKIQRQLKKAKNQDGTSTP